MKESTIRNEDISSIYVLKAICAAGVVYLHYWYSNEYIFLFSKLAVPIFFAISGYFLFDKKSYFNDQRLFRTILKTIKLILLTNLLYLIYNCIIWLFTGVCPIKIDSPIFFLTWLFIGGNIAPPLWYLNAYVETLITLYIIVRITKLGKYLPLIFIICYLGALILGRYAYLFHLIVPKGWIYTNFLFLGIPFVSIGMFIKRYESFFKNSALFLFIIAISAFILEMYLYRHIASYGGDGYIAFTSCPLIIAILALCLQYKNSFSASNLLAIIGKKYSLQIYILHFLFLQICLLLNKQISLPPFLIFIFSYTMPIIITYTYKQLKIYINEK